MLLHDRRLSFGQENMEEGGAGGGTRFGRGGRRTRAGEFVRGTDTRLHPPQRNDSHLYGVEGQTGTSGSSGSSRSKWGGYGTRSSCPDIRRVPRAMGPVPRKRPNGEGGRTPSVYPWSSCCSPRRSRHSNRNHAPTRRRGGATSLRLSRLCPPCRHCGSRLSHGGRDDPCMVSVDEPKES